MNNITFNEKAETYFKELEQDKIATHASYQHITAVMDEALIKEDLEQLLALIPYLETGEGALLLKYIGETHRILRILNIIALEKKYHKTVFSCGCSSKKKLYEKYMLILFALRRLRFQLSECSVNEAVSFLQQNKPSVFAIYVIIKDDLIIPNNALYDTLLSIGLWDSNDQQFFLSLIHANRS